MHRTKNYKALIWDMGGVILKTFDAEPRIKLAQSYNMTRDELEDLVFGSESSKRAEKGLISEEEHFTYIKNKLNIADDNFEKFLNDYWAGDSIDWKIIEFIKSMRNKIKIGLLSNAWSNTRINVSKHYDFLDNFDVSIFSAEVKLAKPDPKIYDLVLQKLDILPEEAIFIDDFIENIYGAKNFGITGIHFVDTDKTISMIKELMSC